MFAYCIAKAGIWVFGKYSCPSAVLDSSVTIPSAPSSCLALPLSLTRMTCTRVSMNYTFDLMSHYCDIFQPVYDLTKHLNGYLIAH